MCQTTTAPPLSAALIVMSLRLRRVKSADHSSGLRLKSTVAIEFKFRNIVQAFLEEKVYCSKLAIGGSPFGFAVVKFLKNVLI